VAKPLGLDTIEAASGIVALVEAKMARTIEEITIGRGADPRDHILFAYGGGGPLVAAALASELGVRTVVVPPHPGVFSAWGMQTLDIVHDFSSTVVKELPREGDARLEIPELQALAAAAHEALEREQVPGERRLLPASLELRYDGQEHSLEVPIADAAELTSAYVRDHFAAAHERAYGFTLDDAIEMVACRLRAVGLLPKPRVGRTEGRQPAGAPAQPVGERLVTHRSSGTNAAVWPVFQRTMLGPQAQIDGPAIIEEQTSTTLVLPGWSAGVDDSGNLVLRQ
jgi:N-methylhydantoinase A